MKEQVKTAEHLREAREITDKFRQNLPASITVASLGVKQKTPFKLLCAREALIWRTEELARNACEMLERGDVAAGILLTRAVTESTALIWRLYELLTERHKHKPEAFAETIDRMLLGRKNEPEFPQAINVLTLIDHMDRKIPGVRRNYDNMSETAHPNWNGVFGLFAQTDYKKFETNFGRDAKKSRSRRDVASTLLSTSLLLFEYAYNAISDAIPDYLSELDGLWGDELKV